MFSAIDHGQYKNDLFCKEIVHEGRGEEGGLSFQNKWFMDGPIIRPRRLQLPFSPYIITTFCYFCTELILFFFFIEQDQSRLFNKMAGVKLPIQIRITKIRSHNSNVLLKV